LEKPVAVPQIEGLWSVDVYQPLDFALYLIKVWLSPKAHKTDY
jgi:hypothetical protein